MGQFWVNAKLLRDERPVGFKLLKFANEISKDGSIGIDKPIELVSMRRWLQTRAATVLYPLDELIEVHSVSQLRRLVALIKRHNAVPRIAHKSEFEIRFKLLSPDFMASLLRETEIQDLEKPVFSPTTLRPVILHVVFNLPQAQVGLPWLPENSSDAGGGSFGHLDKNAFVFMRDHCPRPARNCYSFPSVTYSPFGERNHSGNSMPLATMLS